MVFPKPQKERDLAFSLLSLEAAAASEEKPPNLKPDGIGAPFIGPEILTLLSSFSGEGTRSGGAGGGAIVVGEGATVPSDE